VPSSGDEKKRGGGGVKQTTKKKKYGCPGGIDFFKGVGGVTTSKRQTGGGSRKKDQGPFKKTVLRASFEPTRVDGTKKCWGTEKKKKRQKPTKCQAKAQNAAAFVISR